MTLQRSIAPLALLFVLVGSTQAGAQGSLGVARDLYASAAYEEALAVLDALPPSPASGERTDIARYRALCLFALGRVKEAETTIELMVAGEPLRRLADDSDMPPRMRAAIHAARQRILPEVVQKSYAEGKSAFDARQWETASVSFRKVLQTLEDPDLALFAAQPPLSDVKTLALGFLQLSLAAIPPPPAPAPPVASRPTAPDLKIYSADDGEVTPPEIVRQELPPYPGVLRAARMGVLEVLVDATGAVESATMRISVDAAYDRRAVAAASEWSYRPAVRNGVPVRFVKRIRISLAPSPN